MESVQQCLKGVEGKKLPTLDQRYAVLVEKKANGQLHGTEGVFTAGENWDERLKSVIVAIHQSSSADR